MGPELCDSLVWPSLHNAKGLVGSFLSSSPSRLFFGFALSFLIIASCGETELGSNSSSFSDGMTSGLSALLFVGSAEKSLVLSSEEFSAGDLLIPAGVDDAFVLRRSFSCLRGVSVGKSETEWRRDA